MNLRVTMPYSFRDKSPEIFIMNMPGTILNPDDFNQTLWAQNSFDAEDPEYSASELVDEIPSFAPYYRETGRKVSQYYKKLFQAYYTKQGLVDFADASYQTALQNIFNTNTWGPSNFIRTINDTRSIVRESGFY